MLSDEITHLFKKILLSLVYGAVGTGLYIGLLLILAEYAVLASDALNTLLPSGCAVIIYFTIAKIYKAIKKSLKDPPIY